MEDSIQVASIMLSDSKARQMDDTIGKSAGLHSQLKVIYYLPLPTIDETIGISLKLTE